MELILRWCIGANARFGKVRDLIARKRPVASGRLGSRPEAAGDEWPLCGIRPAIELTTKAAESYGVIEATFADESPITVCQSIGLTLGVTKTHPSKATTLVSPATTNADT